MELAPIVIFTFNRLSHVKNTITSLQKNYLATESELFIFSDAGRNEIEENKVIEVRDYLYTIKGFKSIKIIEAKYNKGLANSVIEGVTDIINKYNKVIVLEDDIVTSPYFLQYMNECLNCFENSSNIWSISAYSPKIKIPTDYNDDLFLTYRGSSWGWATWKDRWDLVDWEVKNFDELRNDKNLKRSFNISGNDCFPMLNEQMKKRINSWAIRWTYSQFLYSKVTIYPIKSLVTNIGHDSSGTNSPKTKKFETEITSRQLRIHNNIEINENILLNFKKFNNLSIKNRIGLIFRKCGVHKQVKKILKM